MLSKTQLQYLVRASKKVARRESGWTSDTRAERLTTIAQSLQKTIVHQSNQVESLLANSVCREKRIADLYRKIARVQADRIDEREAMFSAIVVLSLALTVSFIANVYFIAQ